MADIEHLVITDAQRHPPKGASTASAGQVMKATGADATAFVSLGGDLSGAPDAATVVDLTIAGEAQGDLLYRGASAWLRLAIGASNRVLTVAAGIPAWVAPVAFDPTSIALADNTVNALRIHEGARDYLTVTTTDGAEAMGIGSSVTDCAYNFASSGLSTWQGAHSLVKQAGDAAAVANALQLYAKDDPAGDTALFVRSDSGAVKTVSALTSSALATGDLSYYDGNTFTRLAVGGAGTLLGVAAGVPAWGAITGINGLEWTINADSTAAAGPEESALILLGGDGVAAPNDDVVRTYLRQDAAGELVELVSERNRNGGGFAAISTALYVGAEGSTADVTPTIYLSGGTGAANRTAFVSLDNVTGDLDLFAHGAASIVCQSPIALNIASQATGDILMYSGGWVRLAAGSNGQVLTLAAGVPSWAAAASGIGGDLDAAYDYPTAAAGRTINIDATKPVVLAGGGTGVALEITTGSISLPAQMIIGGGSHGTLGTTSHAIGYDATASGESSVAVGHTATATGIQGAALGVSAVAGNDGADDGCIAIGYTAQATGPYSVAMGRGAVSSHQASVALGILAVTTASNQIMLGRANNLVPISHMYFGGAVSGNLFAATINVCSADGTNISADTASLSLKPGAGTGTGAGGHIILQTANAGASGASLNAYTTRLELADDGHWLIDGASGDEGDVITSHGAGATPTWEAPGGGGGMVLEGSNTTEATTTSTTSVDVVTVSGLSITVDKPILIRLQLRKTAGAAATCFVGLKINSTVVGSGVSGQGIADTSSTDQAEEGYIRLEIPKREGSDYTRCGTAAYIVVASSTGSSTRNLSSPIARTAAIPNSTITSITILGSTNNAAVTLAVKNVFVYTLPV